MNDRPNENNLPKEALTPKTIGDLNLKFRIPLYQRPYAWEEAQVRQLLNDLKIAFDENASHDYHIGILSVAKAPDGVYDLIDGQQRITTLILIGKAAGMNWLNDRLYLYGRNEDNIYLKSEGDGNANCNPRMRRTVKIAEEYVGKDAPRGTELAAFVHEHAAFFISEVPSDYTPLDKNQQFVRFNNRGRQLEKHEILKVRLIDKLPTDRQIDVFKDWDTMTELISGVPVESSADKKNLKSILQENGLGRDPESKEKFYRAIVGIEEFLLIALARTPDLDGIFRSNIGMSYDKSKLLATFEAIEDDARKIELFVNTLKDQTDALKRYIIFCNNVDGKYVIDRFADSSEVEADSAWLDEEEVKVRDIQSFLYVSTTPHKWLIPAFDWLMRNRNKVTATAFVSELEQIDRKECESCLPSLPDHDLVTYGNINHYWFYRLDYELLKLWRNRKEDLNGVWNFASQSSDVKKLLDTFRFRHCGSVEHIIPQHQIENGMPADHSFRNLALISGSRNSKFNNNPTEGKKSIILHSEYTESLKMLHFLWGDQFAEEHGISMYNILKNSVKKHQEDIQP